MNLIFIYFSKRGRGGYCRGMLVKRNAVYLNQITSVESLEDWTSSLKHKKNIIVDCIVHNLIPINHNKFTEMMGMCQSSILYVAW